MRFFNFITIVLASNLVDAFAITSDGTNKQTLNQTIMPGEYILANGGKSKSYLLNILCVKLTVDTTAEIVDELQLKKFLMDEGISLDAPAMNETWLSFTSDNDPNAAPSPLSARQASCSGTTSYVTDKTEKFVDWDVQMSPVVIGVASGIDVTVSSGWSLANSVKVSAGLSLPLIKDKLSSTFGIDYTRTWTTTTSLQYKVTIENGKAGVWITQPWTTRRYGRTFQGCPGSLTQTGTWIADSHDDGSYDNAKWVSGFISACIKEAPTSGKLTRCNGSGDFL